jgi:hypothetical protein
MSSLEDLKKEENKSLQMKGRMQKFAKRVSKGKERIPSRAGHPKIAEAQKARKAFPFSVNKGEHRKFIVGRIDEVWGYEVVTGWVTHNGNSFPQTEIVRCVSCDEEGEFIAGKKDPLAVMLGRKPDFFTIVWGVELSDRKTKDDKVIKFPVSYSVITARDEARLDAIYHAAAKQGGSRVEYAKYTSFRENKDKSPKIGSTWTYEGDAIGTKAQVDKRMNDSAGSAEDGWPRYDEAVLAEIAKLHAHVLTEHKTNKAGYDPAGERRVLAGDFLVDTIGESVSLEDLSGELSNEADGTGGMDALENLLGEDLSEGSTESAPTEAADEEAADETLDIDAAISAFKEQYTEEIGSLDDPEGLFFDADKNARDASGNYYTENADGENVLSANVLGQEYDDEGNLVEVEADAPTEDAEAAADTDGAEEPASDDDILNDILEATDSQVEKPAAKKTAPKPAPKPAAKKAAPKPAAKKSAPKKAAAKPAGKKK